MRNPWLAILILAVLAAGCAHREEAPPDAPLSAAELEELERLRAGRDPTLETQRDFGLSASILAPGSVQVTIENRTAAPQEVTPLFFRMIVPPSREQTPPLIDSLQTFPVGVIAAGEQASGVMSFPAEVTIAGARLVFLPAACRVCQPAMAQLQKETGQ